MMQRQFREEKILFFYKFCFNHWIVTYKKANFDSYFIPYIEIYLNGV